MSEMQQIATTCNIFTVFRRHRIAVASRFSPPHEQRPYPSVSVTVCLTGWFSNISTRPEGHRTSMSTGALRLPNPKVSQGLLVERPEPALTSWTYASVRPRGP